MRKSMEDVQESCFDQNRDYGCRSRRRCVDRRYDIDHKQGRPYRRLKDVRDEKCKGLEAFACKQDDFGDGEYKAC